MLSEWLTRQPDKKETIRRQEAIRELTPLVDWRQDLQVAGHAGKDSSDDLMVLIKWVDEVSNLKYKSIYRIFKWIMPVFSIFAIIGFAAFDFSFYWFLSVLVINGVILGSAFKIVFPIFDIIFCIN